MAAKTIDEYLSTCIHHEHYHELIREGWVAAMKAMESAPSTSTNSRYATAREVYDEYIGMYGDADDSPIFNDWLIERLHAEERHDA
jgi:hypothetical protein